MSEPVTRVSKRIHLGWTAETIVPLGFTIEDKPAQLAVTTCKRHGGTIDTYASVETTDGMFTQRRVFRDYSERVDRLQARATEKSVTERHKHVLLTLPALIAAAIAHHYAAGDCPVDHKVEANG